MNELVACKCACSYAFAFVWVKECVSIVSQVKQSQMKQGLQLFSIKVNCEEAPSNKQTRELSLRCQKTHLAETRF